MILSTLCMLRRPDVLTTRPKVTVASPIEVAAYGLTLRVNVPNISATSEMPSPHIFSNRRRNVSSIRLAKQPAFELTPEQKQAAQEAIEAARKMEEAKKQGNTKEMNTQAEKVVRESEEYLKEELKKKKS